jgi:hypothetical protein
VTFSETGARTGGGGGDGGGAALRSDRHRRLDRGGCRRRDARRGGRGGAEAIHQADRGHVDVALVADGVVDAVALELGAQRERRREGVLQTQAGLPVRGALARVRVVDHDHARAAEPVLGLRIGDARPAEDREVAGDRQRAHQVEVQTADPGLAAERARGGRPRLVAERAQAERAAFEGEVPAELVAAEHLAAERAVVVVEVVHREAVALEVGDDARLVDPGAAGPHLDAAVEADRVVVVLGADGARGGCEGQRGECRGEGGEFHGRFLGVTWRRRGAAT